MDILLKVLIGLYFVLMLCNIAVVTWMFYILWKDRR